MKAIIMAGGEGRRLRPVTHGLPKPLVEIEGRPVLDYTVENLRRQGFSDIVMTLRYKPADIIDRYRGGDDFGVSIKYTVEDKELGTAGGVKLAARRFPGENVLVVSGDGVWDMDLDAMLRVHRFSGAAATLALYEHPAPENYGVCELTPEGRITGFTEKPKREEAKGNLVNAGIYILSPEAMEEIPEDTEYDFGKELFPRLLQRGFGLYGFKGLRYWCDIGTPETYYACCDDMREGRVSGITAQSR